MHRRQFIGTAAGALAAAGWGHVPAAGSSGDSAVIEYLGMDAEAFRAARRLAATPFGRIAYVERGRGPAALFLHGFPLNGFQWRGALGRLAGVRRCIAPDFMGLGYTEVAQKQNLAPAAQAEMVVSLLDALSIPDVDLVASDSGGAVAQLLVARYAGRVRTLLLTNCDTEHDSPPPALGPIIDASRAGTFADDALLPQLADKTFARSERGLGGLCYSDGTHPTDEAVEYFLRPLVSSPHRKALVHAYAMALERNPLEGIGPTLKRCPVPTRIIWGTADVIFSAESSDYLDRTFGNSRGVRRLEGRNLFWPEELPDVLAGEARRLWGVDAVTGPAEG